MPQSKAEGQITPLAAYTGRASGSLGATSYGAQVNGPQFQIQGAGPEAWFGPSQPLAPFAPPGTGGRQYDYPFGTNLLYTPRGESDVSFIVLRNLADALPEVRIAIEHRKAEVAAWEWDIQPVLTAKDRRKSAGKAADDDPRALKIKENYLRKPDKRRHFAMWLGALMEDMLVVDAATIYPRYTEGGDLWSLDTVDGTTIKPLIDETGRPPMPDVGPAYQQVLHGVPAADFHFDELMYLPRNVRTGKLYGMSPVEQIILTVNIALRRQIYTLNYYTEGNMPEGFYSLPKEWDAAQIKQWQEWWDAELAGNLAGRQRLRFMPAGGELIETKQPPLKDMYDEWLMRIICAAFNVSPSPYVMDNTKATAQTVQLTTSQRGAEASKLWIKSFMDDIIQERLGYSDLEFVWSGDDNVDPLQEAQTQVALVGAGIMTVDECRVERGLDPYGIGPTTTQPVTPLLESYKAAVENIENPPPPPTIVQAPPGGGAAGEAKPAPAAASAKQPAASTKQPPAKEKTTKKGALRSLYVHRLLKNAEDVSAWAKKQGFNTTLDDMHVTIAFSRIPVDWDKTPSNNADLAVHGGKRELAKFGEATVLKFEASALSDRHDMFRKAGASWDYAEYHPHVTLTYDSADVDLDNVEPYSGPLVFGGEDYDEIDEDWKDRIAEKGEPARFLTEADVQAIAVEVAKLSNTPFQRRRFSYKATFWPQASFD